MCTIGEVRFSQASNSSHSPAVSLACTTQGQCFRLFPLGLSSASLKVSIVHCFLVFRFSMECINLPLGRILYKYIPIWCSVSLVFICLSTFLSSLLWQLSSSAWKQGLPTHHLSESSVWLCQSASHAWCVVCLLATCGRLQHPSPHHRTVPEQNCMSYPIFRERKQSPEL